tara:strand:+ start:2358 stop:2891 length:534 start_codon:yes stop_codon:yes gene_type:complete
MTRLTTKQKLWGTLGIIWIAMLLLVGWLALENRQTIVSERRDSIQYVVESVQNQIEVLQERVAAGELSLEEAQQRAIDNMNSVSFGAGEYIFSFNDDLLVVSHPSRTPGTDMTDYLDASGMALYPELLRVAQTGGGHVNYYSTRAGGDEQLPKTSYVAHLTEWKWSLGSVDVSHGQP